ncbi:MAG: hypothetical protein H0Z24_08670 [Thermosipho sp. (in: Bacteria)]|nr:hypothetical protein [Thermosipho sp. (in: thermotogales)]
MAVPEREISKRKVDPEVLEIRDILLRNVSKVPKDKKMFALRMMQDKLICYYGYSGEKVKRGTFHAVCTLAAKKK